ncbi:DUF4270 domain-containing protein [Flavobacterium piscisymbiosum]|uniref:DUF4270 domain-containing protein n=1 Tax=Flavobacterium piscisymbiosum TaxID=2893753 RepID=A0ABS8M9P4_9FLAO|nr:DUF4270 domain-containing protein [Flavobacterium sp. F-30]MCC9062249.1 DUF4270 domain-containing protein [Flavobacterium sp. F-30]
MYNTSFIKKILLVATVVLLYSCDKDFNEIGEGLIGDDHFGLEHTEYDVLAYNQEVTPVQSNGLTLNGLGIYDDAVFGTTTANFVSQVALEANAPTIGESPEIESVVLSVPYFSHATAADPNGGNLYALDSIYGDKNGKLKLSVYESGYQMRSSYIDGGSQFAQLYYTDQDADFFGNIAPPGNRLNDAADPSQNDAFFFSNLQQKQDSTVVDANAAVKKYTYTYTAPEMRLKLNKQFFLDKILKAPASKLSSTIVFQEYFRGLYFKVEKSGSSPTNLALLNFFKQSGNAKITIKYKAKTAIATDPEETMEDKTLVINLSGASTGLYNDAKNPDYAAAIASPNKATGDERLYLRGGQGSLAVIELFGKTDLISYDDQGNVVTKSNGVSDQLDEIRNNVKHKNWLANEANLVFSIDAAKMTGIWEPKRIYLYDLVNSIPIVDFSTDGSTDGVNGKIVYSGIINLDPTTKRGTTYKIRLTSHIRNLIKDATVKNVKLGLVVTGDINTITSGKLKNRILIDPKNNPNDYFSDVPRASIMSPLGTVLFGGNIPSTDANYAKRLQLQVYYTKPN